MSISISNGTSTITPSGMVGYQSTQASQSVLHQVIGRGDMDVSYAPTGLRSGTMTLLFSSVALVEAARVFYAATGGRFVYTDGDFGGALSMTHVLNGNLVVSYVDDTTSGGIAAGGWTLAVDFQEVV